MLFGLPSEERTAWTGIAGGHKNVKRKVFGAKTSPEERPESGGDGMQARMRRVQKKRPKGVRPRAV